MNETKANYYALFIAITENKNVEEALMGAGINISKESEEM